MLRTIHVACISLGLLGGTLGCNSFLTGDKLTTDPNNPTAATIQTLFVSVQSGQFALHEGTIAMMACMWVQACGATGGRFVFNLGIYNYGAASNTAANVVDWGSVYDGGGLIDLRSIKADAISTGDSAYLAIAKIWEAFTIGTATDVWGGVPYTQVTTSATPDTDSQFAVYDSVQSLLKQAIAELTGDNVSTHGPGVSDFVFAGDRASWIAAAWTLKARYWLHVVPAAAAGKLPSGLSATQVYDSVIAAASNGIKDPSGAHDVRTAHFSPLLQQNIWAQFQSGSGFGGDLEAGRPLTNYMNARSDPRRALYFCPNALKGYGGDDFNPPTPAADSISNFACQPYRFQATRGVPLVTYAENELMLAEAYNQTGTDALALTHLNNELAVPGSASDTALTALPAVPATVVGPALLDSIMKEKWVAMFQNIETLMDYERTCVPAVAYVKSNFLSISYVPKRLFYPQAERNVNAAHIPTESQEITGGLHTAADLKVCP